MNWIQDFNKNIPAFIDRLCDTYGMNQDDLLDVWTSVVVSADSEKEMNSSCCVEIKWGPRAGQPCEGKISKKSKSRTVCNRHISQDGRKVSVKNLKDSVVFMKNNYGRYVFGSTGLIIVSEDDRRVCGKELSDGTVIDLTDEDIKLCQLRKLKYIANYTRQKQ